MKKFIEKIKPKQRRNGKDTIALDRGSKSESINEAPPSDRTVTVTPSLFTTEDERPLGLAVLKGAPSEIWTIIFSYLENNHLGRLSKTCHTFRIVTEPFLYREIRLRWSNYRPAVYFFLRTLIERPSLGMHVKHLTLCCSSSFRYLRTCALEAVDLSIIAAYILSAGFEPADLWHKAASHIDTEAIAALVLSLVPNTQELQVSDYFLVNPNFVASVLRHAASNGNPLCSRRGIQPFSNLHTVNITAEIPHEGHAKWEPLRIVPLSDYISLPALKEVNCEIPESLVRSLSDYQGVWPITKLSCQGLETWYLAHILLRMPCLQILEYKHLSPTGMISFNCTAIYRGLLGVKDSLKELTITYEGAAVSSQDRVIWNPFTYIEGTFGSLREFEELTDLYIPFTLLTVSGREMMKDRLPKNLRTLTFNCDPEISLKMRSEQLRDFLSDWRTYTPYLELIVAERGLEAWPPESMRDMKEMCGDAGVNVEFAQSRPQCQE